MNLSTIITLINQDIPNINTPMCIYIAIGSAAHMVKREDGGVDDLYYHQFPKFLEEMHQAINMTTFHILIDPDLESPPFMTVDNSKGLVFDNYDICQHSTDKKHIVYCMRHAVTMSVYTQAYTDITHELHQLNDLAMENKKLLVYNDFTGRNTKPLANYFDDTISKHLDHIIYGLGNRGNHGCYIDILNPSCKLAFKLEGSIKVFNPFHMLHNKLNMAEEIETYPFEHIEIITTSIENILDYSYKYFNNILGIFRILYQLIIGKCEKPTEYFVETLDDSIKELFVRGDYRTCFEQFLIKTSYDLEIIIYLKNIQMDKIDLMKLILSDANEYNWGTILKNIIDN